MMKTVSQKVQYASARRKMSTPASAQHNPKARSRNGEFLPYFGQKRGRIAADNVDGGAPTGCGFALGDAGKFAQSGTAGADVRRRRVNTGVKTRRVPSAPAYSWTPTRSKMDRCQRRWCPCNWSCQSAR